MFGIGSQAVAAQPAPAAPDARSVDRRSSGGSGVGGGGIDARSRADSTASVSSTSPAVAPGSRLGQVRIVCVWGGGTGGRLGFQGTLWPNW